MPDRLSEKVRAALAEKVGPDENWSDEWVRQHLAALCDNNDRLRALLREYGWHQEGCPACLEDRFTAAAAGGMWQRRR